MDRRNFCYADLVIKELRDNVKSLVNFIDPAIIHLYKTKTMASTAASFRPRKKCSYSPCGQKMGEGPTYRTFVSYSLPIEVFFLACLYPFASISGRLKKPNLVLLDMFKNENIIKYHEYIEKMERLPDKTKFHFFDEKHLVNKVVLPNKTRADPLTGYMNAILVRGDFREAYNLLAIISSNPTKPSPIHCVIGKDNGSSKSFTAYIMELISSLWFEHGDVLILDNSAIHSGGDAGNVKDYLWDMVVDERPLNVLVIFLPTRSPELI
jgi:hypothetical protein